MGYILNRFDTWPRWLWLIILSLLAAAIYLPLLNYLPLYLEEPRRALIAANMLSSGDFLIPIHAGQIYLGKPPLFNWLICITSLPFGTVSIWTARLPSVLTLCFVTLFLVSSAWQHIGKRAAIFWGCALLLNPKFLLQGQLAEVDMVFACLVTAALWSWWLLNQRCQRGLILWLPPLLFVTLAYLTKREPALVFFYLSVGTYLLLKSRGRELFSLAHIIALFLAALPIFIWIIALAQRVGWNALWNSMLYEVILRGDTTNWPRYAEHVLTYPLQILLACAPFSLLLLVLINSQLRYSLWKEYKNITQFATLTILINLPLYWFKGRLAIRYFLPMFPFILLLAALCYTTLYTRFKLINRHWIKLLLPSMVALMLMLRGLEFMFYQPIKKQYLQTTQNAPAIIADVLRRLPSNKSLFVSERIPSAIWLYAPPNVLHLLNAKYKLIPNDYILRHVALTIPNTAGIQLLNSYHYENDTLLLEKIVPL